MVNHSFIYSCTEMSEKLNFDVESRKGTGIQLAKAGYAVHGIDYQGHGKSEGLQGFVADFDELVDDCFEHFSSICGMCMPNPTQEKKAWNFTHSVDRLISVCSWFCAVISVERKENRKKMKYLFGESMGGAVALHLHRKTPNFWDGAVLVAPMCKVVLSFHRQKFKLFREFKHTN